MAMAADPAAQKTVQVRFSSKDPSLQIEDRPIVVPTDLRRYGLSEIINHLLETPQPVPFSFLINGELLGTTVAEHLLKKGLSSEAILEVEYVRSILPPSFLASYPHDDWTSAVRYAGGRILTGSYDAMVRVWDQSQNCLATAEGHTLPVKHLAVGGGESDDARTVVSASMDRTLRLWKLDGELATLDCTAELRGHVASVEGVDMHDETIVSVSSDGHLGIWNTSDELGAAHASERSSSKRKRAKAGSVGVLKPRQLHRLHGTQALAVALDGRDRSVAYTVGLDDRLVATDLNTLQPLTTIKTSSPLFSVCSAPKLGAVLSGGQRNIHVHDLRSSQLTSLTLQGHRNFVAGISIAPAGSGSGGEGSGDDNLLASAGYDGEVRVWDVRNPRSLYTIKRHRRPDQPDHQSTGADKVMCIDWADIGILSGGEDCQLQVNRGVDRGGLGAA